MQGSTTLLHRLSQVCAHLVVALVALVAIGGATRVMEAGLACPDWPLCYGGLLPLRQMNVQVFLEWFHRLDAFLVGLALLVLSALAVLRRRQLPGWYGAMAALALLLVAVQGSLGALTVTQLLAAGTVTAHLTTALLLLALVSALQQRLALAAAPSSGGPAPLWWQLLVAGALLAVLGQCLLGGAMASQWAAQRCLDLGEGCRWLALHRRAAPVAGLLVLGVALSAPLLPAGQRLLQGLAAAAGLLVIGQVALGQATLRLQLHVPAITVGHQIGAALLVALLAAALARSLGFAGTARLPSADLVLDHG